MFWGLSMEPQKRYTQTVAESFHISQAALDLTSLNQESSPTQIVLEFEGYCYILATLSKNAKIYQVPLDLNFQKGDVVGFRTVGPAVVHLSGYHILEDDDDLASRLMGGSDDDADTDEEVNLDNSESDVALTSGKKRKKTPTSAGKEKKSKLEDSEDDGEGEKSLGSTLGDSTLLELDSDEDDEEDDDDDDDDEDDDDEDDDDDDDDEDDDDDDEEGEEEEEKVVAVKKDKGANVNGSGTPGKKKLNSSKNEAVKTPKDVKVGKLNQSKQEKTPKPTVVTPKQEKKTPKAVTPSTPSQKKVLEGGIVAEDTNVGSGPPAKAGKTASVYYIGRLKSNNKQFDAVTSGSGFKFRIGRGEVIKGWDVGVAGMRVGGKRRLTIPAAFAYGAKGSPPVIPPNATLVFEIELRGVS